RGDGQGRPRCVRAERRGRRCLRRPVRRVPAAARLLRAGSQRRDAPAQDPAARSAALARGGVRMTTFTPEVQVAIARVRDEVAALHAELTRYELVAWTGGNV